MRSSGMRESAGNYSNWKLSERCWGRSPLRDEVRLILERMDRTVSTEVSAEELKDVSKGRKKISDELFEYLSGGEGEGAS
jgi:hypothetical protein